MFEPFFLLSFCAECSLEIIPMLGLAWFLGWLFWWAYNKSNFQQKLNQVNEKLIQWQNKSQNLEEQLSKINFDWESVNTELKSHRNNYMELEVRYKALEAFKGTSANTIYEPVPPPVSLIKELEEKDKASKKVIYFSPEKTGASPKKAVSRKVIKAKSTNKKEAAYSSFFSPNDLTIVDGIGPKLEKLLKKHGISTWTRLAVTSVDDLKKILAGIGPKLIVHDPSTWPQQASLARVGQWMELIQLQKSLSPANKSKVKKAFKKSGGINAYRIDDLKIIEGIGPKIEQLLKDGGIDNWSKLASATNADIQQILSAAGDRYRLANPDTWAKQAKLANEGSWTELKNYQARLKGGMERK